MKKSKQGWIPERTCTDKKKKQQVAGKLRSHKKKKESIISYWGHKEHWGSDATSCCYCCCCSSSLEVLEVGSSEVHHMVLQISQRFSGTSLLHLEDAWATTELSSLVSGLHDCVLQGFLDVAAVPEQGLGYKEAAMMNSTITEDGSVDFKGRPADKSTTGGWKTAPFIFGMLLVNAYFEQHLLDVQFSSDVVVCASSLHACLYTYCCKCAATAMFEMIVSLGIAFNLNSYLSGPMHIPNKLASQYTTFYWGTSFMTSLIGGFISDTYLGRFWTSVLAAVIELLVKSNKPIISLCCMSLLDTSWMAQLQSEIVNGILEHHHLMPSTVSCSACCFTLPFPWNWQEQLQDFLVWTVWILSAGNCAGGDLGYSDKLEAQLPTDGLQLPAFHRHKGLQRLHGGALHHRIGYWHAQALPGGLRRRSIWLGRPTGKQEDPQLLQLALLLYQRWRRHCYHSSHLRRGERLLAVGIWYGGLRDVVFHIELPGGDLPVSPPNGQGKSLDANGTGACGVVAETEGRGARRQRRAVRGERHREQCACGCGTDSQAPPLPPTHQRNAVRTSFH